MGRRSHLTEPLYADLGSVHHRFHAPLNPRNPGKTHGKHVYLNVGLMEGENQLQGKNFWVIGDFQKKMVYPDSCGLY